MAILGQNPADITGAAFRAKNLSDLPDKAAARTNLNVPSKDEVAYNSVPIGMILPYWGSVAPSGYLPCSGQTVNSTTFPDLVQFLNPGQSSATVPDLRGEFLRGWDNGRGIDTGRTVSTLQLDSLQNITGSYGAVNNTPLGQSFLGAFSGTGSLTLFNPGGGASSVVNSAVTFDASRVARTSTETRPRNVAVLYCIKAYNSVQNYTSSINIAGLVSDYSTLNAAAVKYTDFTGTNQVKAALGYQKLPGGAILQWGNVAGSASGPVAFTFPIAFPNGLTSLTTTVAVTPGANGIFSTIESQSSSGASYQAWSATATRVALNCYYVAIGY